MTHEPKDACEKPEEPKCDGKAVDKYGCVSIGCPLHDRPAPQPKDVAGWEEEEAMAYDNFLDVARSEAKDPSSTGIRSAMALDRLKNVNNRRTEYLLAQAEKSGFLRGLRVAEGAVKALKKCCPECDAAERSALAAIAKIIRDEEKKGI